ncbi:MAG: hypothetical protein HBSAPP01_25900 [Candidatus Brocadia sapporoensis]|nr:MAG: hypothetical protein HBSAPP01_25900 [Candidatus Brocadia sapporoensis]
MPAMHVYDIGKAQTSWDRADEANTGGDVLKAWSVLVANGPSCSVENYDEVCGIVVL